MCFTRKYPKALKVSFRPKFISNMLNYTKMKQINRLEMFVSLETDRLKIIQNCLETAEK